MEENIVNSNIYIRFTNFVRKHVLFLYTIVFLICLAFCFILFRKAMFGGYYFHSDYILSDSLRANIPTYTMVYDNLMSGKLSFWNWEMGIGTSMMSHADAIFDIFTYITFLGGRENIASLLIWSFTIKICCESVAFAFLMREFSKKWIVIIISSLVYAFSSVSIIVGTNLALGTVMVYFPLALFAIEKHIKHEKRLGYIIGSIFLALICIQSYYYFIISIIVSVIYLIFRIISLGKPKEIWIIFWRYTLTGTIAMLLSMFAIVPQVVVILSNPRVSSTSALLDINVYKPDFINFFTVIVRLFNINFFGNAVTNSYVGGGSFASYDYFQLCIFTSIINITFVFYYMIVNAKKWKTIYFGVLLFILSVLFPFFSLVTNLFITVNFRWMYMLEIILAIVGGLGLESFLEEDIKQKNIKLLVSSIISFAILCISIHISYVLLKGRINSGVQKLFDESFIQCLLMTICITAISIIFVHIKNKKILTICSTSFLFVLLLELSLNYGYWLSEQNLAHKDSTPYYDSSYSLITDIQKEDCDNFYRINKTFDSVNCGIIPSCNDAMVQQYMGLKSYNSSNNGEYVRFLQSAGIFVCGPWDVPSLEQQGYSPFDISGQALNYIGGCFDRYNVMSFLGVKYLISNNEIVNLPTGYEKSENYSRDYVVYINKCAYPLAFVNDEAISYKDYLNMSKSQKDIALLKYTIVDQESDIIFTDSFDLTTESQKRIDAFHLIKFTDDRVEYSIEKTSGNIITMSMPYDSSWKVTINGKSAKTIRVAGGMLGIETTETGTLSIVVSYTKSTFIIGCVISLFAACTLIGIIVFVSKKERK